MPKKPPTPPAAATPILLVSREDCHPGASFTVESATLREPRSAFRVTADISSRTRAGRYLSPSSMGRPTTFTRRAARPGFSRSAFASWRVRRSVLSNVAAPHPCGWIPEDRSVLRPPAGDRFWRIKERNSREERSETVPLLGNRAHEATSPAQIVDAWDCCSLAAVDASIAWACNSTRPMAASSANGWERTTPLGYTPCRP